MRRRRWRRQTKPTTSAQFTGAAAKEPLTLNGITFSDELGGFTLLGGWGVGSSDDPFVLIEAITGDVPAVLIIRGLSEDFGNPVHTNHFVGFALTKVVINRTLKTWDGFMIELQEELGVHSTYHDGLSFGQDEAADRVFVSDRFGWSAWTDEPADGVVFSDGLVLPGERVAMSVVITENSPRPEFYLIQHRPQAVASAEFGR